MHRHLSKERRLNGVQGVLYCVQTAADLYTTRNDEIPAPLNLAGYGAASFLTPCGRAFRTSPRLAALSDLSPDSRREESLMSSDFNSSPVWIDEIPQHGNAPISHESIEVLGESYEAEV